MSLIKEVAKWQFCPKSKSKSVQEYIKSIPSQLKLSIFLFY